MHQALEEFISLYVRDVREHPDSYKERVRNDPEKSARSIASGLTYSEMRRLTRDLRAERAMIKKLTRNPAKKSKRAKHARVVKRNPARTRYTGQRYEVQTKAKGGTRWEYVSAHRNKSDADAEKRDRQAEHPGRVWRAVRIIKRNPTEAEYARAARKALYGKQFASKAKRNKVACKLKKARKRVRFVKRNPSKRAYMIVGRDAHQKKYYFDGRSFQNRASLVITYPSEASGNMAMRDIINQLPVRIETITLEPA